MCEDQKDVIFEAQGVPCLPNNPNEKSKFKLFKSLLSKYFKKAEDFISFHSSGKKQLQESEGSVNIKQAIDLATSADIKNQEAVGLFYKNIDDLFEDNTLPLVANTLKLAKLIENNPELEESFYKAQKLIDNLSLSKGFDMQVISDPEEDPEKLDEFIEV